MIKAKIKEYINKAFRPTMESALKRASVDTRSIVAQEVEKALKNERKAIHWIVRNEILKSQYNIHYAELREASESSYEYAKRKFSESKAFDDKFQLRDFLFRENQFTDGLFLEFGVFKGESIRQIAELFPERSIHGFDSFEGLPEDWRFGFSAGHFDTEIPSDLPNNVKLHKGWFSDSLPEFLESFSNSVSLLHIDCDLYSSTKLIFDLLAPRLEPGSIILFDEYYNYPGWQDGEYRAFHEYLAHSGRSYDYLAHNVAQCQTAVRLK